MAGTGYTLTASSTPAYSAATSAAFNITKPAVTGVSPTSGPTAGGTTVTITGTGFTGATKVVFGAVAATSYSVVGDTEITAVSPAQAAGTNNIYVTAPGGTSPPVAADDYTYVLSKPAVTGVSPTSGPTAGGTAVTITGSGFVSGATVVIGQGSGAGAGAVTATNVKVVSPTEITAVTGGGAKGGTWSLFVTTSGGTSTANVGDDFTYKTPSVVPTVTAVSPKSGPITGGTAITITGTGFVAGATVVIGQGNGSGTGAIAATNVKVVSSTEITAVTGGGAKAGTWSLFVTTSGGTSTANVGDNFTY
jgi:hypothetical protein